MGQSWPAPPPRILSGQVSASSAAASTVTFPVGYFTTTPRIVVTTTGGVFAYTGTKSAASFQVATNSAVATLVDWIAMQS